MNSRLVRRARHYQKSIAIFIMLSLMMGMARAAGETKPQQPVTFLSR